VPPSPRWENWRCGVTWIIERRGRYVLVGGLGGLGVGMMWMWEREDGSRIPIPDPFREPSGDEVISDKPRGAKLESQ